MRLYTVSTVSDKDIAENINSQGRDMFEDDWTDIDPFMLDEVFCKVHATWLHWFTDEALFHSESWTADVWGECFADYAAQVIVYNRN